MEYFQQYTSVSDMFIALPMACFLYLPMFINVFQKRWEHLLALGKRVFVVGDLNIAPASIDRCDAPPGFEKQM